MINEALIDQVFDAVLIGRSRCQVQQILERLAAPPAHFGIPVEKLLARARVLSGCEPEAAFALREIVSQYERKMP